MIDLSAGDLTLLVDGKPVPIDTFHAEAAISTIAQPASSDIAPSSEKDLLAPPTLETVIFIDESTAAWLERRDVFDSLTQYLRHANEPRRVVVYDFRKGFLHLECPWTSDSAKSAGALMRLRDQPTLEFGSTAGISGVASLVEFDFMRHKLLGSLLEALAAFPNHPARRQMILITGGRTLAMANASANQFDGPRNAEDGSGQRRESDRREILEKDRTNFQLWSRAVGATYGALTNSDVVAKAIERDVALIAIDTSTEGGMAGAEKKQLVDTPARPVLSTTLEIAQALMKFGKDTGGEFIPARSTADSLAAIDRRRYFAITFRDPFEGDHRFHEVLLRCRLPRATLGYRHGFRVADVDERILDTVLANLVTPSDVGGPLALNGSATVFRREDGKSLTHLRFHYSPPRSLSDTADRPVDVIAVGRNPAGEWTAPIRWSGTARQGSEAGIYESALNLGIPPGAYTWSVAFRDTSTSLVEYMTLGPPRSP